MPQGKRGSGETKQNVGQKFVNFLIEKFMFFSNSVGAGWNEFHAQALKFTNYDMFCMLANIYINISI